jgi:hypothetical protein
MIVTRPLVFALLFFSWVAFPAAAQVQTPMGMMELRNLCASKYDVEAGLCAGYITAVADAIMRHSNPNNPVCLSPAIGPQTLVVNVMRSWKDSPPAAGDSAFDAVEGALKRRFRCS